MHIDDAFAIRDVELAKSIVRAHPFATLVTTELRATHMPCLVDEERSGLIPTWNHVTLHIRGTPEVFDDAMPVLRRTVEHFESAVQQPWSLSRDKPADERIRVLAGLERTGAYENRPLAATMRKLGGG